MTTAAHKQTSRAQTHTRKHTHANTHTQTPHQLSEAGIIDALEAMCAPEVSAGLWLTRLDIVENGDALDVVDTRKQGKCGVECATLAKACEQAAEAIDLSDLSEALYR